MTVSLVEEIAREIEDVKERLDRSVFVAIDGRSGSGKTSLAFALARRLRSAFAVQLDTYHVPVEAAYRLAPRLGQAGAMFDWRRFQFTVLHQLENQRDAAIYWTDLFSSRTAHHRIESGWTVIADGTFSTRHDMRDWYDLKILVECSSRAARERLEKRDTALPAQWQTYIRDVWQPDEDRHIESLSDTRHHYDHIVNGESTDLRVESGST